MVLAFVLKPGFSVLLRRPVPQIAGNITLRQVEEEAVKIIIAVALADIALREARKLVRKQQ